MLLTRLCLVMYATPRMLKLLLFCLWPSRIVVPFVRSILIVLKIGLFVNCVSAKPAQTFFLGSTSSQSATSTSTTTAATNATDAATSSARESFVVWPLELGLGTHNPRFFAWPLELGLGTHNPCFVAWPLELGLGTHNPRFGYKVTVAVDMLGNIIWICPLAPGTSADVLIWDGYGPSRTRGDFFDFEVGGHDGAYKGRIDVIVPFIGRKNGTLTARQQCYNDVPYGPWEHVPPQVWTDQSNSAATQDEAEDEVEVCVLCCQRRSTVAVCDECKEHYCNECIDTHTCGTNVVC